MRQAVLIYGLLFSATLGALQGEETHKMTTVKKLTANLYVEDVRLCVTFWEKLGFEKVMEVPDGAKLAFALLKKGDIELMYGSYASLEKEPSGLRLAATKGPTFLYVDVENLDDAIASTQGAEVIAPVHTTFYGAKEFTVKDPGGHVVTFAQFTLAH
jgi:uncharacterized glyoxalase superfamily protein PhnB